MSRSGWETWLCPGLDPVKGKHAVKLSVDKCCSATIMLGKTVDITHDNGVVDTGGAGA